MFSDAIRVFAGASYYFKFEQFEDKSGFALYSTILVI